MLHWRNGKVIMMWECDRTWQLHHTVHILHSRGFKSLARDACCNWLYRWRVELFTGFITGKPTCGRVKLDRTSRHYAVYICIYCLRVLWQPNVCMCAQKKIALPISVSHQMYVCGGCDKVHARNCVSVCGEVEEAFINVWVWVRVITCLHLCVCERHCVCQRKKKPLLFGSHLTF